MPHIDLPEGAYGIRSVLNFRPETARPLLELAEVLLRGENSLSRGERELIAAHVSGLNECVFCEASHSMFAALQLDGGMALVEQVKRDPAGAPISPRLCALLTIAGKVSVDGRSVTDEDVAIARREGATDLEIHDTVLIAAAFSMYNRYVDGLATLLPPDEAYEEMGRRIVERGYLAPAGSPPPASAGS
ncbi:MAG TPA: peroxidase-related enzyme [Candidatus Limnocylindrales bacterium]